MIIRTTEPKKVTDKFKRMGFEYKPYSYFLEDGDRDAFYFEVADSFQYAIEDEEAVG